MPNEALRNRIAGALMRRMGDTRTTMQYPPLNAQQLIAGGALRVTQPGSGTGGYETTANPNDFSLVTRYNDLAPDSVTRAWPDKPASYAAAQQALADPQSGALYDGKYRQILWSAEKAGMNTGY